MSAMVIKKAERKQAKIRLGFSGPSGSGKTMSALRVGRGMVGAWDKICVIDTEHNSADLYAHLGDFSTLPLSKPYSPERFIEAIETAERAGFQCIIIDSLSHEWEGPGGILDIVDAMGGKMWHWKDVTPRHAKLINKILHSPAHIIATLRTKADYAISTDDKNKTVVQKIGLKPVTKDGFDYELTLSFDLDINNHARASKDRTNLFMRQSAFIPTEEAGEKIVAWCNSGTAVPALHVLNGAEQKPPALTEAQAVWEAEERRINALTDELKAFFRWYVVREKWGKNEWRGKMLKIMTDNQDDPEALLSFAREKGWQGTAELSDVAKDDKMPGVQ